MKLPIRISEDSREPIYHQVELQLKTLIIGGHLPTSSPIPSIRALAADLNVSVITVRRAYQNLEANGFIKTIQGKGTFVREVALDQQEETKNKVAYEAFEKAVEQGRQVGCTDEEIKEIFMKVIQRKEG